MFVNLGDIDRFGHADLTGPLGLKAARRAALADTDLQVGRFVDALKSSGRWERLDGDRARRPLDGLVDARQGDQPVGPARGRPAAGRQGRRSPTTAAPTSSTGPAAERRKAAGGHADARDRRARARRPRRPRPHAPTWLRLGPRPATWWCSARPGWRFSDPDPVTSNPIPGNHGHPATRHDPVLHRRRPPRSSRRARRRRGTRAPSTSRRRVARVLRRRVGHGRVRRPCPDLIGAGRSARLASTAPRPREPPARRLPAQAAP